MIKMRVPSAATGGSYTRLAAMRSAGKAAPGLRRAPRGEGPECAERARDAADRPRAADRLRGADRRRAGRSGRDDLRARLITRSAPRARARRLRRRPPGWWR